jgi:hypothetical protein
MAVLKSTMEYPYLDVPLRTEGKVGPTWGDLAAFDDNA